MCGLVPRPAFAVDNAGKNCKLLSFTAVSFKNYNCNPSTWDIIDKIKNDTVINKAHGFIFHQASKDMNVHWIKNACPFHTVVYMKIADCSFFQTF